MAKTMAELDASIQAKLEADTDFQNEISALSDEEKAAKITERKQLELDNEFSAIASEAEKAKKAEELASNYKTRAEKAEGELKRKGEVKTPTKDDDALSPKDYLALTENKVTSEDFDEVLRVSKILGKSVADTIKDKTMKVILEQRAEERATASAAQAKGSQRGAVKITDEQIVDKAIKGQVPDSDEEIEKLAAARMNLKVAAQKK